MKRINFSTVRKKAKGVKVFHQNLLSEHQVDPIAEKVMEELEVEVSPILYGMLIRSIRGFDEAMQLEMAECLVNFAMTHRAWTTGVDAADFVLDVCYLMIADDHDILKKNERSRMKNYMNKHMNNHKKGTRI